MDQERVRGYAIVHQRYSRVLLLIASDHEKVNDGINGNDPPLPLTDVYLGTDLRTAALLGHQVHLEERGGGVIIIITVIVL